MKITKVKCLETDSESGFIAGNIYEVDEPIESYIGEQAEDSTEKNPIVIYGEVLNIFNEQGISKPAIIYSEPGEFEIFETT